MRGLKVIRVAAAAALAALSHPAAATQEGVSTLGPNTLLAAGLAAACGALLIHRKLSCRLTVINVGVDSDAGKLEVLVKNNRREPVLVKPRVRLVERAAVPSWLDSHERRAGGELGLPAMAGASFERLHTSYALVGEHERMVELAPGETRRLIYGVAGRDVAVGSEAEVRLDYINESLTKPDCMEEVVKVRPRIVHCGLPVFVGGGVHHTDGEALGASVGGTLHDVFGDGRRVTGYAS